ncbi:TonB family protein [Duganella sp. FT80W]|uniref:TonB family protein n=1 Tax=Duganella guangzhouensis TaxID=2666084 RepID=A0A6I2KUV8_9BURK|nr:energy transducer TonB [Duganella guangzhouensis]MRW89262.1 TonB family protein [Duganella guangzhouensis]
MNQKKNLTGISTVVLLHVALLAAFLHGSKLTVIKTLLPEVDLVPTQEVPKPKEREPQVEEPQLKQPEILVPRLTDDIPIESPPSVTAREMTETPPAQPPAGPRSSGGETTAKGKTQAAPVVIPAVVDAQACSKPDYPKNALRNGDTGTVMLAFLIGSDGKVADSRIEKSSGFRELDRAAQAGLTLCKFKPGTVDGVPQQSWTKMQYVWSLD